MSITTHAIKPVEMQKREEESAKPYEEKMLFAKLRDYAKNGAQAGNGGSAPEPVRGYYEEKTAYVPDKAQVDMVTKFIDAATKGQPTNPNKGEEEVDLAKAAAIAIYEEKSSPEYKDNVTPEEAFDAQAAIYLAAQKAILDSQPASALSVSPEIRELIYRADVHRRHSFNFTCESIQAMSGRCPPGELQQRAEDVARNILESVRRDSAAVLFNLPGQPRPVHPDVIRLLRR